MKYGKIIASKKVSTFVIKIYLEINQKSFDSAYIIYICLFIYTCLVICVTSDISLYILPLRTRELQYGGKWKRLSKYVIKECTKNASLRKSYYIESYYKTACYVG